MGEAVRDGPRREGAPVNPEIFGMLGSFATMGQMPSGPRFRPSGVNGAHGGANWGTKSTQSRAAVKAKARAKNKAARAARKKGR